MEQVRYPIGHYQYEGMTKAKREMWISEVEMLPVRLRAAIDGLTEEQLDHPYRSGGWTLRQTIHHIADASMNCFIRFKLTLTETNPTIKPFNESLWAQSADSIAAAPAQSLMIIEGIHARWTLLLQSLEHSDYEKQFYHPELGKQLQLSYFLGFVAWHGNHHIAHITSLKERMHW